MKDSLIALTDQTIAEWMDSESFQAVKTAQEKLNIETIKSLLASFRFAQEKYHDVKKYGKYHPDLARDSKAFQDAKVALYTHPLMVEYQTAARHFQQQLDLFTQTLAHTISKQISIGHIPR
jgi:cell fate (sporulation/competence/biofilm development) regulator YlbF (YheA/YmcA/DUF963 family)